MRRKFGWGATLVGFFGGALLAAESTAPILDDTLRQAGISRPREPRFIADAPVGFPTDSPHLQGASYHRDVVVEVAGADRNQLVRDYGAFVDPHRLAGRLEKAEREGKAVRLAELLPGIVTKTLGKTARRGGTNCANAVLRFRDESVAGGNTDWETFHRVLERDYRLLGEGDAFRPGDIVVLWDSSFRDLESAFQHTAVYVGGGYFYMKPTKDNADPYVLQTFGEMTAFYNERFPGFRVTFHRYTPVKESRR